MRKKLKPYLFTFIIILFMVGSVHTSIFLAATVGFPTVTIDSPSLQGKTVTVSGTVEGTFQTAELYITDNNAFSSSTVTVDPATGRWSYQFLNEFSSGNYHYVVVATATYSDSQSSTSRTDLDFTVDATGPAISITSPSFQNEKQVIITGTVSDGYSTGDQLQMQLLDANSNPINDAVFSAPTSTNNQWSYTLPGEFADGTYNYNIKATDSFDNSTIEPFSITIDTTRPKATSIKVDLSNTVSTTDQTIIDLLTSEKINYVKKNTSITITITDNKMLTADKIKSIVLVYSSAGVNVPGTTTITRISNTEYNIVFIPDSLSTSTTYYIYINPAYIDLSPGSPATTDEAGNPLFPLIRKFTTEKESDTAKIPPEKSEYYSLSDPHGNYKTNTNTCNNCHSTHVSQIGPKLEQSSFEYSTYNYCMACHDGTVAAPPENMNQNGHFPEYNSAKKMATDCSTCHNPHLAWRAENPNLLDNHYVVENHPNVEGVPSDMFDSDKLLCESCHAENVGIVKDYVPKDANDPIRVLNKVLHYRKSTATGISDDYALCFRCHDGSKENIPNIKTYFENTNSKHRITAIDGGQLVADGSVPNNGHIPCAECHNTHGSENKKILNEKIGHEDRRAFSLTIDAPGEWDATKERSFCIKCHNGSTAIYGVTGKALQTRSGHDPVIDQDKACSSCHGTGATPEEKALSAAHAPK